MLLILLVSVFLPPCTASLWGASQEATAAPKSGALIDPYQRNTVNQEADAKIRALIEKYYEETGTHSLPFNATLRQLMVNEHRLGNYDTAYKLALVSSRKDSCVLPKGLILAEALKEYNQRARERVHHLAREREYTAEDISPFLQEEKEYRSIQRIIMRKLKQRFTQSSPRAALQKIVRQLFLDRCSRLPSTCATPSEKKQLLICKNLMLMHQALARTEEGLAHARGYTRDEALQISRDLLALNRNVLFVDHAPDSPHLAYANPYRDVHAYVKRVESLPDLPDEETPSKIEVPAIEDNPAPVNMGGTAGGEEKSLVPLASFSSAALASLLGFLYLRHKKKLTDRAIGGTASPVQTERQRKLNLLSKSLAAAFALSLGGAAISAAN